MIVCCPSCQRSYVVSDEQIAGKQFRARCKSCGVEFRLDGTQPPGASTVSEKNEPAKFMSATEAFLSLQSAPPPAVGAWSIALSKTDTRRMSTEEAAQAYAKGTFGTDVLVWKSGMQKWIRFSEVPELMAAIGKPASKIPAQSSSPGSTEKSASMPSSELPTKPGTSVPPVKGTKFTGPVRSGTLLGTGASQVPRPSASPPKGFSTQPPPLPEAASARGSAGPGSNEKAKDGAPPKSAPATVRPRSKPGIAPRPSPEIPGTKVPAKATQTATKSEPAASKLQTRQEKSATPGALATAPERAGVVEAAPTVVDRELEIVVELEDAQASAGASGSGGGVVLPPLKGAEAQTAGASAIAAANSLASVPPKTELADAKSGGEEHGHATGTPSTDARAQSDTKGSSEVSDVSAARDKVSVGPVNPDNPESRPSNSSAGHTASAGDKAVLDSRRDSHLAPNARKAPRFAGVVVAIGVVGVLGVLGGVAGAVYVMKGTGSTNPSVPSVVAFQPQPATPVSASATSSAQEPATEAIAATTPSNSVQPPVATDAESTGATSRHSVDSRRGSALTKPSAAVAAKVPVAKAPIPAANTPPAAAATTPFNRESALAVLGFAASRASTCKKPDGPKGSARVQVTFDPSGAVVAAGVVGAPIAGTPTAQCVAAIFRKVRVAPFSGDRVTIPKDFTIPP